MKKNIFKSRATLVLWGLILFITFFYSESIGERKSGIQLEDDPPLRGATEFSAINISNSRVNSMEPQIVMDGHGQAYVIWVRMSSPKSVYFNTNASGQWGKPIQVSSGTNVSASGPWPHFVIDSQGTPHIVFTAKNSVGNYEVWFNTYYGEGSAAGGWGSNYNVSQTAEGGSAYPTVAVDPNNLRRYVVWQDDEYKPDIWALFFRYRDPSSESWSGRAALPIPTSAYTPKISVDGRGRLHLIWLRRGGGSSVVYYARNDNPTNPNGWTDPLAISGQTNIDFSEIRLATDSQGNVYVAWEQRNGSNYEIYFRRCIQGDWTGIVNVSQTGNQAKWPGLAVNWTTGDVYLVWQQKRDNKWQIFIKTLISGVWSAPTDLTANNHNSIMPSVAIDNIGEIHLAYAEEYSGIYDIMYATTGEIVGQGILPPIGIKLVTKREENPGFKKNIIRWKKNPDNDNTRVKNYRLYRKEVQQGESQYKLIATLGKSTFSYEDRNLPDNKKFSYVLTTVDVDDQESDFSDEVAEPLVFNPVDIIITSRLDTNKTKKINIISWKENPLNSKGAVSSYRIYRREARPEAKFQFIKAVSGQTFSYEDKNLSTKIKYEYYLTATDKLGLECEPSLTAFEDPVFPPRSITVVTTVNESLFFVEKVNVVRWKDNPLNDPVEVGQYRIYRRDLNSSSGTDYVFIGAVEISKRRFFDRNLEVDHKYSYVLTAVTVDGQESQKSHAVTEGNSN
jgi:fibronectin type 3 domain-containing protein